MSSFLCFPSHVKAIASHYLRNNVNSFDTCSLKTANSLAELNCRLLEDENPWVRQEALESFDHVAHVCPNEELITKMAVAVTKKPGLSDSLPAYLSGTSYYELPDFTDVRHYLRCVANNSQNTCHVCYRYEETQRDEKLAKLETQSSQGSVKSSSSILDESVYKVCDELNDILRRSNDISDSALRKLRLACAKILDLTESLK